MNMKMYFGTFQKLKTLRIFTAPRQEMLDKRLT